MIFWKRPNRYWFHFPREIADWPEDKWKSAKMTGKITLVVDLLFLFLFVERYRLSGRPQAVGESVAWFKWFSPAAPGGSFRNRLLNLIFFQFHFTERWWALFQLCSTPMNVNQWNHVKKNFGKIPRETSVEMTGVGSRWRGRGPMRRQTEKEKSFTRFTRTRMKRPSFRSPGSRVYLIT